MTYESTERNIHRNSMVSYQKSVQTCVMFRKLQGMTLFVLHREDSIQQFAPSDALKRAAELPRYSLSPENRLDQAIELLQEAGTIALSKRGRPVGIVPHVAEIG